MDAFTGMFIGAALVATLWYFQTRRNRLKEQTYRLFVEFHEACNKSEEEGEKAWSRYLNFFVTHNWNAGAFQSEFERRIWQTCEDAKKIGKQRTGNW
jgi:hypothetical protein